MNNTSRKTAIKPKDIHEYSAMLAYFRSQERFVDVYTSPLQDNLVKAFIYNYKTDTLSFDYLTDNVESSYFNLGQIEHFCRLMDDNHKKLNKILFFDDLEINDYFVIPNGPNTLRRKKSKDHFVLLTAKEDPRADFLKTNGNYLNVDNTFGGRKMEVIKVKNVIISASWEVE